MSNPSFIGKLKIGTEVLVSNKDKFIDKKAVVMFVGKLAGKNEQFIGVELQTPDGTHAGTFQGKQYFKAKENHGMFAKPKAVKMIDGSPLTNLLTSKPQPTGAKTIPVKPTTKTTVTKPGVTTAGKKPTQQQNKLSDQLKEAEVNQQLQSLKQELQEAKQKIEALESTDTQQEINAMRQRIRELEDQNRMLKVQEQKAKLQTSESSEQKTKELQEKIDFFNSQKQFQEKEKAELKKKIARLEEELESYDGTVDQLQKLTFKIEALQTKNAKLKEELEAEKTQNRNNQMLGAKKESGVDVNAQLQQMRENIKILNETISLVEGDLNEEKEKSANLQKELQTLKSKGGDVARMQKKIKSMEEQLQALKAELQASSDAATFAQKLTLDLLRKQQSLKESTAKLTEYLNKIEALELQVSESKEMIDLQTQELQTQEEEVQKALNQKQEQINHIAELNKQIAKYKSKIAQLAQNNESLLMTTSQIMDQTMGEDEMLKTYINTDVYQHKYFQTLKTVQLLSEKYLEAQLQSFSIKNVVGVQMLNLMNTIPESYTQQFYPEIVKIVIDLKTANDKLYLLFDTACSYFKTRADIYSKDNLEKAHWLVMLLEQVPLLYGQLTKIELSIITAENEEEIGDIVSNTVIKDIIRKIDAYASEILLRFAADSIDASIDLDPFIEPVQTLDNICGQGRKLQYEHETKNKLCVQTMAAVHKIFQIILTFKQESEVGENAQVDTMIENFLKSLLIYLKECCTNPHIRIKTETKQYLSGLQLIIKIFEEIQMNETIPELSSLYSDTEDIKMLKQTLLTTQFHLKELINDLQDIVYPNLLSKIKCNLPGKVWIEKANLINTELNRFQELLSEKQELQTSLMQAKRKILILEKDIKDRQATKQLYEKRIGELQLKVEQASSLQSENKKHQEKLKSYQDTNKLIEDELHVQVSKKKELEEEVRKLKEKIQAEKAQGNSHPTKSKEKKLSAVMNAGSINNEEVTSLSIFKNVLQECHTLRTIELKKNILKMKQSPLLAKLSHPEQKEAPKASESALRRKALQTVCELKVIDPRKKVQQGSSSLAALQSLQMEIDQLKFSKEVQRKSEQNKQELTEMKIGSFLLKNNQRQTVQARVDIGCIKVMSY